MISNIAVKEELTLFQKTIEAFAKKEIEPYYEVWEEQGIFPRDVWNKLGEAGLLCVDIPEKYGGLGTSFPYSAKIVEELSKLGYGSLAGCMSVHSDIVAHYVLNSGNEQQKEYYLPKMVTGEMVGAIAMTEPAAGSDLQGIQTSAQFDEATEQYVINGSKTFITNGQHFDFVVAAVKTDSTVAPSKGTTLFILEATAPGVTKGKKLKKLGLKCADTSELFFEEVRVPATQILGQMNRGFITLMQELARERTILAVGACAAMVGALSLTKQYIQEREAFGKPLAELQVIRHKIAEMETEARLNQVFVDYCIAQIAEGKLTATDASMAKLSSTEAQGRVVDGCLQLFGGYGYMEEYPISRFYIDARVQRIYGGTSEIMKEIISKSVLGK